MRLPLLLLLTMLLPRPAGAGLVVTDLRLVDPVARTVTEASVWIEDGIFRGFDAPDGSAFDATQERWSAGGRFALPPLADLSVIASLQVSPGHRDSLGAVESARLLMAFGIQDAVDLSTGAAGSDTGARLRAGAPVLVAADGVGSELPRVRAVRTPEDARAAVADLAGEVDRFTVIFDRGRGRRAISAETLRAVLAAAGPVPVAVHVGTWADAWEALDAGATLLVQIPAGPIPSGVVEQVERVRPFWAPALAVAQDFMALMADEQLRDSPALARALPGEMRADYGQVRVPQGRLSDARLQNEERVRALGVLRGAGARLVAASQSGGLGTAHGWTLVRELEAWVAAGVEPWEVLAGATTRPAGLLGLDTGFAPGRRADFALYPASPVEDPGVLLAPDVVFRAGERLDPGRLAAGVSHRLTERIPDDPLPGGRPWTLPVIAISGFAILLFLRHLVRRAAAGGVES